MTMDSEAKLSHPPDDRPKPEGLALPHRMGNYELTAEIASGGSGLVYRARQIDLGRTVAVKVLRAGTLATEEEVHRFHAEAEAAARLDHSSIVPVYEVGAHEGRPFISMKLVDGPSLDRCIERYRDDPRAAASLVARVARAVDHGHRHAVLHRDVKPSNVLLGEDGTPYVVDFGTAKLLDAGEGRTVTGSIIGTPYYMAPEQVLARGDLTVATDVYGLGCVLYELLVGRPPLVAEGLIETLQLVVESDPTPIRSVRPDIHRDLATICHTCLRKDPARRYASALALAEDLERWLKYEPIRARPTARIERMWLAARRKPLVTALLAAIALLSVTLVVGTVVTGFELRAGLERTRAAEDLAREQLRSAYLAEARFVRTSKAAGRRARGLDLVRRAADIRPGAALVTEAVASLALTDLVIEREWRVPPDALYMFFDPAFERYLVAYKDGRLKLRRAADDVLLEALSDGGPPAWQPRFSRDGRYLAVTFFTRFAKKEPRFEVWDLGRSEIVYSVEQLPTCRADFAPGRPEIVVSFEDGPLFARNLESGHERTVARFDEDDPVREIAFDPAGGRLAVAGREGGPVRILSANGELRETLEGPEKTVTRLAWSPDGARLVAGSYDFRAYVWQVESGELVTTIRRHRAEVANVLFPHLDVVATYSWDGTSRLWDLKTGEQLLYVDEGLETSSSDGLRFACRATDMVRVRRLTRSEVMHALHGHVGKSPSCLDVSPDDRWAASGGPEGVLLWDLDSGARVDRRSAEYVWGVLFHDDALYVGSHERLARWAVSDGRFRGEPQELVSGHGYGLDHDRDGDLIVASMASGIHLLYPREPARNVRLERPSGATNVVVSPDGKWVAAGSWRGSGAHVWRTSDRALVAHLEPAASVCQVDFSPDGRRLVVAVQGRHHVYAVGPWTRERSHDRSGAGLTPTRHSPDGRLFAATLTSWEYGFVDATTGTELMRLIPPERQIVNEVRFSRDMSRLFVATNLNRILVWDLQRLQGELAANGIEAPFSLSVGASK